MKKIFGIILIAILAMVSMASASFDVSFTNPVPGTPVTVGSTVMVRTLSTATDEDSVYARLLIDGVPTGTSAWTPTVIGTHVLEAQLANNAQFVNPTIGTMTVEVVAAQPVVLAVTKPIVVAPKPVVRYVPLNVKSELYSTSTTKGLDIAAPGLLKNDNGGPSKSIYESQNIALLNSAFGEVFVNDDGSFTFQSSGKQGYAVFYYKITDDTGAVSRQAYCQIAVSRGR